MKKFYIFIFILLSLFISFIMILIVPKNYTIKYEKSDFIINEKFSDGFYSFIIKYDDLEYPFLIKHKYSSKRKLINSVKYENNVLSISVFDKNYNLKNSNDIIFLSDFPEDKKVIKVQKNINFYNKLSENVLVWNYYGYLNVDDLNVYENKIFSTDYYNNELTYNLGKYLLIPNYDDEYEFNYFYLLNIETNKLEKIESNNVISYNSYYLGDYDNCVFLVDKKYEKEYKIDVKNKKIKVISKNATGVIYNPKEEKVSVKKLVNTEYKFYKNINYDYYIENDKLYLNIEKRKVLVCDKKIFKIVTINNDTVYFLADSILYKYTYNDIVKPLLSYDEWEFNNSNTIFIH